VNYRYFKFSSPSLCQRCKALAVNLRAARTSGYGLPFGYRQSDIYGRFPALESLANSGCQFCAFLRSSLHSKIFNRPFKSETPPSGSDVIIQIESLFFGDSDYDLSQNLVMEGNLDISVHRGSILEEFFRIEFQTQQRKPSYFRAKPLNN
jgi:hypothetical protein